MNKTPKLRFKEFSGDWESKKLGKVTLLVKDGTHGTHADVEQGPYLLSAKNIKDGKIVITNEDRKISYEDYNSIYKNYSLLENDILLSIVGTIGRCAVMPNIKEIAFQRSVAILRFNLNANYVYQYMNTRLFQNQLLRKQVVSAQPGIYLNDLKNLDMSFPSKEEQEKIASFFSLIDNKISLQGEKLEMLKDYKRGMMQKIFSRELRFKDDDGRDYPEWEEKKLGELGKFYRGHSYNAGDVNEEGILVLRSNNIKDNVITFDTELQFVTKKCKDDIKLRERDIVICMANGSRNLVGKSGEFNNNYGYKEITIGAFCSIYRTNNPLGKYLLQIDLYYKYLDTLLSGTNINNLKNSQLEELKFNIPTSNKEIEKIVNILNNIDLKIEREQEKLDYLNEYKKGLQQQMFI